MEKVHIGGVSRRRPRGSNGPGTPRRGPDAPGAKPRSVEEMVRARKAEADAKARDAAKVRSNMTKRARIAKTAAAGLQRRQEVVKTKDVEQTQKTAVKAREQLARAIVAQKGKPVKKAVRTKKTSGDERARIATKKVSTLTDKQRNAIKVKADIKKAERNQTNQNTRNNRTLYAPRECVIPAGALGCI